MQNKTLNQLNITKQIYLNIYHYPSTLVLLKCQDPFRESVFESCLGSEFQQYSIWIVNFNTIPYTSKVCLRIVALI